MKEKRFSYNRIAKWYDLLSRAVFFKAQVHAQTDQFGYLENCNRILIVGGGTGWILEALNQLPQTMEISYVEIADEMTALSKKRKTKHIVNFYNVDVELFRRNENFDAVLTPFLFDNFDPDKAQRVFGHIRQLLKPDGLWLYVDFYINDKSAIWKKLLLKSMHVFFSAIGAVRVHRLVDMEPYFAEAKFQKLAERFYYSGFVKSLVWQQQI